jgi:hypothetical protein
MSIINFKVYYNGIKFFFHKSIDCTRHNLLVFFYHRLVKQSNALDLEAGGAMNTKMNMRIYIGFDRRSIISYVQGGDMFPLLILENSSEELVMREITSLGMMGVCSSGLERVSLCSLRWLL